VQTRPAKVAIARVDQGEPGTLAAADADLARLPVVRANGVHACESMQRWPGGVVSDGSQHCAGFLAERDDQIRVSLG
jgi:hypothetical protein